MFRDGQLRQLTDDHSWIAEQLRAGSISEAEAKSSKDKKPATAHRQAAGAAGSNFQGGVLAGPLYNGQDYLGDDPDPNIRAYLLRDLSGRYGGGR